MDRQPCVYILASSTNGTLYTGVTSDLIKRVYQHKKHVIAGFTSRYRVHRQVWCECHASMDSAIRRERVIKTWRRGWKIRLIETSNPQWRDVYPELL